MEKAYRLVENIEESSLIHRWQANVLHRKYLSYDFSVTVVAASASTTTFLYGFSHYCH